MNTTPISEQTGTFATRNAALASADATEIPRIRYAIVSAFIFSVVGILPAVAQQGGGLRPLRTQSLIQNASNFGDQDGDGVGDLGGYYESSEAILFSSVLGTEIWRGPRIEFWQHVSYEGADFDGDGRDEYFHVLYPTVGIDVVSMPSGAPLYTFATDVYSQRVTISVTDDVDGDGVRDIMTTGETVIGVICYDTLDWYSGATGIRRHRWLSVPGSCGGSLYGYRDVFSSADVDGDGVPDAIVSEISGACPQGCVIVFSGATGLEIRRSVAGPGIPVFFLGGDVKGLPDLNGDGKCEYAAAADLTYTTVLSMGFMVFDGATGLRQSYYEGALDGVATPRSQMAIADINGDGVPEMLVHGHGLDPTQSSGFDRWNTLVLCLRLPSLQLRSQFSVPDLLTGSSGISSVGDLNSDGHTDIVASGMRSVFLGWSPCGVGADACGDCDGDGRISILDALQAARAGAGLLTLTGERFDACNVSGAVSPGPGASVDIVDALRLAQRSASLGVSLTCCSDPAFPELQAPSTKPRWVQLSSIAGGSANELVVSQNASRVYATTPLRSLSAFRSELWVSLDRGATWQQEFDDVWDIACSPFDDDEAIACRTGDGLIRTTNGGTSWQVLPLVPGALGPDPRARAIAYDPNQPGRLIVTGLNVIMAGSIVGGEVAESLDYGQTWDGNPSAAFGIIYPSIAYLSIPGTAIQSDWHMMSMSRDGWRTWGTPFTQPGWSNPTSLPVYGHKRDLVVDPLDNSHVFSTWCTFAESYDSGENWENFNIGLGLPGGWTTSVAIDSTSGAIYVSCYGDQGLAWWHPVWVSIDNGLTFTSASDGLVGEVVWQLVANPNLPGGVYALTYTGEVYRLQ